MEVAAAKMRVAFGWGFPFRFQPVLNIATAELGTIEAERFAANQRDRLRFNLADMSSGLFAIHKLFGRRVTEDNVGDLVECGFVRECGKGDSRRFRVRWRGPECCRSSPQTASA